MRLCRVGLLLLVQRATALHNVTVDDMSSDIIYSGTWLKSSSHEERYAGTTHYTVRKVHGFATEYNVVRKSKVHMPHSHSLARSRYTSWDSGYEIGPSILQ